jgi:hypothetical protein
MNIHLHVAQLGSISSRFIDLYNYLLTIWKKPLQVSAQRNVRLFTIDVEAYAIRP